MSTKIFVNLPVMDLKKSKEFFSKLGYTFNMQFTDEKAACMVVTEDIYFMLLVEKFFKDFTLKEITDTTKSNESISSLFLDSRKEVDEIVDKALAAGAKITRDPQEVGDWMYSRSFEDLDGHLWEYGWMDPGHIIQQ